MEQSHVNIYRRIVSSTAVFGGAQVFNALVNIVRGKLVASILQSGGMGISSIMTNAANSLQQLSLMGLNVSAVPDISKAHASDDARILSATLRIVRRLVLAAALLGLVATLALSPLMSRLSFGSDAYTWQFLLLAAVVFFNVMATGELTVLQGMRRYKRLAFCSTVPPLCGLLLSVPIYLVWGTRGIVPAMILGGAVYFAAIKYQTRRLTPPDASPRTPITLRTMWQHGSGIIKFGAVMTVGTLVGTLTTYLLTIFISRTGNLSDVGFYQAAGAITTQYIGLIFTAMAADYFPHLSGLVKTSRREAFHLVNQQTEILILIMTPLVMLLILTAPIVIRILLTPEFLSTGRMVRLLGMACIFKALCFPMDYLAYAKSDTPYIFWVEVVWGNAKTFAVMALCYCLWGLDGLGYGALACAVLDFVLSVLLIRWRYGFSLAAATWRLITVSSLLAAACLACSFLHSTALKYGAMAVLTLVGIAFCLAQLNRRIDLKAAWRKMKMR